ncbi:MAG: hypothetical protein NC452_17805, partial [Eubacterium sp.]|nr:hypothetical protein [Eubacterium sp.]
EQFDCSLFFLGLSFADLGLSHGTMMTEYFILVSSGFCLMIIVWMFKALRNIMYFAKFYGL